MASRIDPASRRPWRPLLAGALARKARDVVEEIALALASAADGGALHDGAAGRALFYAYLAKAWPDHELAVLAARHLDGAIACLRRDEMAEGLLTGFTGVAWAVEHLRPQRATDEEDRNADVDRALLDLVGESPWPGEFDLTYGLAGIGVYAIERIRRPIGRELLGRIVVRLDELAEPRERGLTWRTKPRPIGRDGPPQGYDCVGVAHGAPAVALMLAGAILAGVEEDRARRLFDGAVAWTLAQAREEHASTFPMFVNAGGAGEGDWANTRSAWCYGDPGVVAALGAAARALGDGPLTRAMDEGARRARTRPMSECGVLDASLCHGSASLAHVYNRLWQSTGDESFADVARRWFARTLRLRTPGQGVAGFRSFDAEDADDGEVKTADASLLFGACGIGLALLAGIAPIEPAWDRLLALSLPPRMR